MSLCKYYQPVFLNTYYRAKDFIRVIVSVLSPPRILAHAAILDYEKLSSERLGETSETIRKQVQAARDIQNKRFSNGEAKDIVCNADMRFGEVRQFCQLQEKGKSLRRSAMTQLNLSARAYAQHNVIAS